MLLNTCRDLQVKTSNRTYSADAKQSGISGQAQHPSKAPNAGVTDLVVLLGWGDVASGSVCEMPTGWNVSQGIPISSQSAASLL